jgi:hypothetical protein
MDKLLIFYLTSNDRPFVFDKFKNEIIKSNSVNKIKLLIVNSDSDFSYYVEQLKSTEIDYDIVQVECPQSDYLPKVRYAIEYAKKYNHKYIFKYDSDVLIPSYTLDFIVENLSTLDNKDVLTISPLISNGIPSVEYFIDDFLDKNEAEEVRREFKKCIFQTQGGIMDYTPLNSCTIYNQSDWSGEKYYDALNSYMDGLVDIGNGRTPQNYSKFYRGMHPVRHGFGNYTLNDFIIKKKENFYLKKECYWSENTHCKQLVAMCFCILTENYDRIMNRENLTIDGCDEIPINRFGWNNNLKHLLARNGYGIHIIYNWQWFLNETNGGSNISKPTISLEQYERNFINSLYE